MAGEIDITRLLQLYFRRPLLALESLLRDLARNLRFRLPHDVGWEMLEVAERGVRLVYAFARDEVGIELLRIQAGSAVRRLGDRCRVHIIDGADHIFSQGASRLALEKVLSAELFERTERRSAVAPGPAGIAGSAIGSIK